MTKKKGRRILLEQESGEGGRKRDSCSIDKHGARGERERVCCVSINHHHLQTYLRWEMAFESGGTNNEVLSILIWSPLKFPHFA
jgi:hypothetical protein